MGFTKGIPILDKKILIQIQKCLSEILINNGKNGTAFFCKIPFPDSTHLLPVLMTDKNLLNDDNITKMKILEFTMHRRLFKISLDINRIIYFSQKYNITIIEIKENDNLDINSFLEIDEQFFSSYLNNKAYIYLLHYPNLNGISSFSEGRIIEIKDDNFSFIHNCYTELGSIGGPLINLSNYKVIGMHIGEESNEKKYGILLKLPILEFYNEINKNCKNNSQIINSFQNNNDYYINELNIKNTYLINEINKLEEELKKEKNENKILKGKINKL